MLTAARLPGRWRRVRNALIAVPVMLAAWAWLGTLGAIPVVIWCWYRRLDGVSRGSAHSSWQIDLDRVSRARLGPWRTSLVLRGLPAIEIFNDEMHPRDLARLRREVKARLAAPAPGAADLRSRRRPRPDQLAAGCSTSRRSE